MKRRYPLDPDDEENMLPLEQALSEAVAPVELPAARSDPLKARLLARVGAAREAGRRAIRVPFSGAEWRRMLPGVRVHRLDAQQRAVLLELAPGASIPFHRHHEDEECVVLQGEARLGEVVVRPGGYHLARPNSRHGVVSSTGGALLFLRGTPLGHGGEVLRDLVTALLPGDGEAPLTIRRDGEGWLAAGPGLECRTLRADTASRSLMLRLAPGAAVQADELPLRGECLLVEGDVAVDDWAMRPGDYRLAREGAPRAALSSEGGALLFVREPLPR